MVCMFIDSFAYIRKVSINLLGLAGLWTIYKPAMFRGRILKDSSDIGDLSKGLKNESLLKVIRL